MLTDLEWVLRRLHNITTNDWTPEEQLAWIKQCVQQWAEEISFKLTD